MNEPTLKPTEKRRHGERGPGKRCPPIKMWNMTGRMERGAALVAADELTDVEIAAQIGVHRTTLEKWKTVPAFVERALELRRQMRNEILRAGIADRVERIKALHERWMRMRRIIEDRGAGVPGHSCGANGVAAERIQSCRESDQRDLHLRRYFTQRTL